MNTARGVTLQISLAPVDFPHAQHILPHQLRQWACQVDEIVLTVDLHRSKSGQFSRGWHERRPKLLQLTLDCCKEYQHCEVREVDYSKDIANQVGKAFFGSRNVPAKDHRGGPYYSYFFGLAVAKYDYVLHLDSDMIFGGGSSTWVSEAIQLLNRRDDVLACSPLPGPPTHDGMFKTAGSGRHS